MPSWFQGRTGPEERVLVTVWGHPAVGPRGVQALPVFPERLTSSLVTFAAGAQWVMPTADEDDV